MALSSMGCLFISLILVVLGVVQGGRPGFPEFWYKADDQMDNGPKAATTFPEFWYKGDAKSDKVQKSASSFPEFWYKGDGQSAKGRNAATTFPEFWYKAGDQSGKGEKAAFAFPEFWYKADDQMENGPKAATTFPEFWYKGDEKLDKVQKSASSFPEFWYKGDGQAAKGRNAATTFPEFWYKAGDQSGKGEKAAFTFPEFWYKADDQLAKPASNHKADEAGSDQETKLDSPSHGAFLKTDLVEGATLRLAERPSTRNRAFLPKTVADELPPLTAGSFSKLQRIFNIQEGSDMYAAMEAATQVCDQSHSLPGEERICPTSFESFLDVVSSLVGLDVKVLTNSARPRIDMGPMKMNNYTQHSVQNGQNVVCHTLVFPSRLYMCHVVPDTEVVEALLTDADGLVFRAIGVCHLDTKMWAPEHQFFKILGVKPGTTVCHWLGSDDLVWVSTKMKESSVIHEALPHGEHMAMDMP